MLDLQGPIAPIPTPFTDDAASVSEIRFERVLARVATGPAKGVLVAGETGEFTTLSLTERKLLVEVAIRWIPRGLGVLVHVSALSTTACLDLAQHAARHGAAAVVAMPPFYGRYTEEEVAGHLTTIAAHAGLPVVVADPFGLVSGRLREAVEQRLEVHMAHPMPGESASRPDAFAIGQAECSVRWLLDPDAVLDREGFQSMLAAAGPARLSKALLEGQGLDVGPTRAPLRALPPIMRSRLDALRAA